MNTTYETRFAGLFGPEYYTFCFWKGRVALYAILKALGIKENDEVIVPGYTCVVVPNAVRFAGAKPIYADIDPGRYNVDSASVEERITSKTRAVIVQHTYGTPADMASLQAIARKYELNLIEDCAHVLVGSRYQGKLLGSFGQAAFFSFQWSKPYTTGLGGIVVTREESLAKPLMMVQGSFQEPPRLKKVQLQIQYALYRHFFKPELYWFGQNSLHRLSELGIFVGSSNDDELTGNEPVDLHWKMSAFQQQVGLSQLDRLEDNFAHRKLLTQCYSDMLRKHGWPNSDHLISQDVTLLRFPVQVRNKTRLLEKSRRKRVELGSWFESPLHPLPLGEHELLNYRLGSCPTAEGMAANVINLPLHGSVTVETAKNIAQFVFSHDAPAKDRPNYLMDREGI
jgi:perosamine synthetase